MRWIKACLIMSATLALIIPGASADDPPAPYNSDKWVKPVPSYQNGLPSKVSQGDFSGFIKVTCASSVQGKISWSYGNNYVWGDQNIEKLCRGNAFSTEPALCFRDVMHGVPGRWQKHRGLRRPDTTEWLWHEAVDLCQGTRNRTARQACFTRRVNQGDTVRTAISKCAIGL